MAAPIGNISEIVSGSQNTAGQTVSRATNSSTPDKDMFLKLLLAQMKYQDPLNPTDSAQYLSQMAQFTTVEKLETMVTNTAGLLTASQMQSALGMVGATVEYGVGSNAGTGVVTGITIVDGIPQLLVNGSTKVPMTDLTSVRIGSRAGTDATDNAGATDNAEATTNQEAAALAAGVTADPAATDSTGTI